MGPNARATTVQAKHITLYGIEKSGVGRLTSKVSLTMRIKLGPSEITNLKQRNFNSFKCQMKNGDTYLSPNDNVFKLLTEIFVGEGRIEENMAEGR